jgi:uncharacterized protein (TIGR03067 family)
MHRRTFQALVIGMLLVIGSNLWAQDDDLKKLEGTWTASESYAGEMKEPMPKTKWTIKGDKITEPSLVGKTEYTFKLDSSNKPKSIEMTVIVNGKAFAKYQGFYELDGDTLKVIRGHQSKVQPKGLSPQKQCQYTVFKRDK